ncbi:hypothetical protein KC330_g1623 [Hortaea werneckii]|nr:hypothetical protein KC330_g1623 [Hortaea werneckii]
MCTRFVLNDLEIKDLLQGVVQEGDTPRGLSFTVHKPGNTFQMQTTIFRSGIWNGGNPYQGGEKKKKKKKKEEEKEKKEKRLIYSFASSI